MSNLPSESSPPPTSSTPAAPAPTTADASTAPIDSTSEKPTTSESVSKDKAPSPAAGPSTTNRKESVAIGPAADDGAAAVKTEESAGPTVLMTLLLTNGKRHPYKLDEKYLRKRNVTVEENDPWNLPVQTLKELILRDWREDWEEKPNSPANIRLISMGLELQEGELLRDKRFNHNGPNIVHMVIKRELPEDEEIKDSGGKSGREDGSRTSSACCGCTIL